MVVCYVDIGGIVDHHCHAYLIFFLRIIMQCICENNEMSTKWKTKIKTKTYIYMTTHFLIYTWPLTFLYIHDHSLSYIYMTTHFLIYTWPLTFWLGTGTSITSGGVKLLLRQLINAKWYLILDVKYTLLIGHSYLIGRKNCDVLLSGDAALAVSRKHAQIELVHPETNIVCYTYMFYQ